MTYPKLLMSLTWLRNRLSAVPSVRMVRHRLMLVRPKWSHREVVSIPRRRTQLRMSSASPSSGKVTSDPPVVPTPASGLSGTNTLPEVTLPTLATPPSAQPSKKSRGPVEAPVTKFYPLPDGASPARNRTIDVEVMTSLARAGARQALIVARKSNPQRYREL